MSLTRRAALLSILSIIPTFPNALLDKLALSKILTALSYLNSRKQGEANQEKTPLGHTVQLSPCQGPKGYVGAEPSSIYYDIHTDLDPLLPYRDHRLNIPGTVRNQKGACIIELHGWVRYVVNSENGRNCSEDPADAKLAIEIDPEFTDQKGINLLHLMRAGSIILHFDRRSDGYAAVSRPKVQIEIKTWHPNQRCDKCDDRLVANPGWIVAPDDLSLCPNGVPIKNGEVWPWDPRCLSNDEKRRLRASEGDDADYVCVIGALVTDTPHPDWPSTFAWTNSPQTELEFSLALNKKEHYKNPGRWTEIHPPDHIHLLGNKRAEETVRCIAVITQRIGESRTLRWNMYPPPDARPHPSAVADYIEIVGPETTRDLLIKHITKHPEYIDVEIELSARRIPPTDGQFRAIYRVSWNASSSRRHINLTRATPGAGLAYGSPFGYHLVDGVQHIVYRGHDEHIHELWWTAQEGWHHIDLTMASQGAAQAHGGPSAYHLGDGIQHVVYRGTDNHIHELWWTAQEGWHHTDLLTAAPRPVDAVGDPFGYHLGDGVQHVVYRGINDHIHELWWTTQEGWHNTSLTMLSPNPVAAAGDPFGYHLGDGVQHVVYRGTDNHIHELWWTAQEGWHHTVVTRASAGAVLAQGDPSAYHLGDGLQHVVYRGTDNHIHELWWTAQEGWHHTDLLTTSRGTVDAHFYGDPTGYHLGDGVQHVIYRGTDNHIHDLWWTPVHESQGWHHTDLTLACPGAGIIAGGPVGYHLNDGVQHIAYLGEDLHIHELWWKELDESA